MPAVRRLKAGGLYLQEPAAFISRIRRTFIRRLKAGGFHLPEAGVQCLTASVRSDFPFSINISNEKANLFLDFVNVNND